MKYSGYLVMLTISCLGQLQARRQVITPTHFLTMELDCRDDRIKILTRTLDPFTGMVYVEAPEQLAKGGGTVPNNCKHRGRGRHDVGMSISAGQCGWRREGPNVVLNLYLQYDTYVQQVVDEKIRVVCDMSKREGRVELVHGQRKQMDGNEHNVRHFINVGGDATQSKIQNFVPNEGMSVVVRQSIVSGQDFNDIGENMLQQNENKEKDNIANTKMADKNGANPLDGMSGWLEVDSPGKTRVVWGQDVTLVARLKSDHQQDRPLSSRVLPLRFGACSMVVIDKQDEEDANLDLGSESRQGREVGGKKQKPTKSNPSCSKEPESISFNAASGIYKIVEKAKIPEISDLKLNSEDTSMLTRVNVRCEILHCMECEGKNCDSSLASGTENQSLTLETNLLVASEVDDEADFKLGEVKEVEASVEQLSSGEDKLVSARGEEVEDQAPTMDARVVEDWESYRNEHNNLIKDKEIIVEESKGLLEELEDETAELCLSPSRLILMFGILVLVLVLALIFSCVLWLKARARLRPRLSPPPPRPMGRPPAAYLLPPRNTPAPYIRVLQ